MPGSSSTDVRPGARRALGRAPRRRNVSDALNVNRARWVWVLPFVVAMFMFSMPMPTVERAIGALLALGLVAITARRPDRALLWLIGFLPFYTVLFAWAYALGLPWNLVRPLGLWKEALLLAVVVAGFRGFVRAGRRLDVLDKLAFGYLACVVAYVVFPGLLVGNSDFDTTSTFVSFRAVAMFVILLLGARHADLGPGFGDRALRVAVWAGAIVAAIGLFEFFFDVAWNDFLVERVRFTRYAIEVLDIVPERPGDYRWQGEIGGIEITRVASVLLSPLACGFYLLVGFAASTELTLRHGTRPANVIGMVLTGTGVLLTQTRSAVIGALLVAVLALRPAAGRRPRQRVQFALVIGALVLVALPAAFATGLAERSKTAATGGEESAEGHIDAFWAGLDAIGEDPLGRGIGTGAAAGQRFDLVGTFVTENNYLQIGIEMGVVTMVVFIGLTIALCRKLRREARSRDDPLLSAMSGAAIGLAVGAFFLHTWQDAQVAWSLWGLAGAALGAGRDHGTDAPDTSDAIWGGADAYAGSTSLGN